MANYLSMVTVGLATLLLFHLYNILWRRPEKLRRALREQGITGPPPAFVLGNILEMRSIKPEGIATQGTYQGDHASDYRFALFPFLCRWRKIYGPTFMFSAGNVVFLCISDPEIVKALNISTTLAIGRVTSLAKQFAALLGNGIITSNGHSWASQRKIMAPEFYKDKVKGMMDLMVMSTLQLLESWETQLDSAGGAAEISVDTELNRFGGEVLSRVCFGSDYTQGAQIFSKVASIQGTVSLHKVLSWLPGISFIPTSKNRLAWKLSRELKSLIKDVVNKRKERAWKKKDFLQTMIDSEDEAGLPKSFMIDNCKSIYIAGGESATIAAQWVLLLLAYHPEWQSRVRSEVMKVSGGHRPTPEMIGKMTLLTQVIQEALRLFPPAPLLLRQVHQDVELGGLHLPKGTCLWIPAIQHNYDITLWGTDADQFNPERFSDGVAGACKHPHMYIPFGMGIRTCLGQNFAMMELKIVLSMILARFKVSPSPNYRHLVSHGLALKPKYGVQIMVERV